MVNNKTDRDSHHNPPPILLQNKPTANKQNATIHQKINAQNRNISQNAHQSPSRYTSDDQLKPLPPNITQQHTTIPYQQNTILQHKLLQQKTRIQHTPHTPQKTQKTVHLPPTQKHQQKLQPHILQQTAHQPLNHLPNPHNPTTKQPTNHTNLHEHLHPTTTTTKTIRATKPDDPQTN